ncbi:hypothetical protein F4805DRAFT_163404 [Annulohypoxylon moriforme]|nr:hypothetical protein F4805DRAFT_163404 [Annulohypoxylon moriforme]
MPPNSIMEWVVGQNVLYRSRSRPSEPGQRRPVFALELSTHDVAETDTLQVTYPRTGRSSSRQYAQPTQPTQPRQRVIEQPRQSNVSNVQKSVRFTGNGHTTEVQKTEVKIKPLPKSKPNPTPDLDTDSDEETTGDEVIKDCPCFNCVMAQKKSKKAKGAKSPSGGSKTSTTAIHANHKARMAKIAKKAELTKPKAKSSTKKQKPKPKAKRSKAISDSEGEMTGSSTAVDAETDTDVEDEEDTESDSDSESEEEEEVPKKKKGKKGKAGKQKKPEKAIKKSQEDKKGGQSKKVKQGSKEDEMPKKSASAFDNDRLTFDIAMRYNRERQIQREERLKAEIMKKEAELKAKEEKAKEEKAKAEAIERAIAAEEEARAKVKAKAEAWARAEAKARAEYKAEAEKEKAQAEKEKAKAREKAKTKAEAEAKAKAEAEVKAEEEKAKAKAKAKAMAKAKAKAEAEAEIEAKKPRPHYPRPENRHVSFVMPSQSRVLHVEHSVEQPSDPHPNAFYDNRNGVMRVYHGPAYGNPTGTLYPHRIYDNQPLPIGTPHPRENPWYNGFQATPNTGHVTSREPPQTYQPHGYAPTGAPPGHPQENQWFQGYGSIPIGRAPDYGNDFDQAKYDREVREANGSRNQSAKGSPVSKNSDRAGRSNVVPQAKTNNKKPNDTQNAHGAQKGSRPKDGGQSSGQAKSKNIRQQLRNVREGEQAEMGWNDWGANPTGNGSWGPDNNSKHSGGNNAWGASGDAKSRGSGDNKWGADDNVPLVQDWGNDGDASAKNDSDRSKKSGSGSKAGSTRSQPMPPLPGGWVKSPTKSERTTYSRPAGTVPDNVGPVMTGSKKTAKGKTEDTTGMGQDEWNVYGKHKGQKKGKSQKNKSNWGDTGVAQSSGGVFDEEDNNDNGWGGNNEVPRQSEW